MKLFLGISTLVCLTLLSTGCGEEREDEPSSTSAATTWEWLELTAPHSVPAGTCVALFAGVSSAPSSPVVVAITSNHGQTYSDSKCEKVTGQVSIAAGTTSSVFYFEIATAGEKINMTLTTPGYDPVTDIFDSE